MKKKKTSSIFDDLHHKFPPIPLYRSNLEEIVKIAQERELQVQISDDEHEYENLTDLQEHKGNKIRKLILTLTPAENSFFTSIIIKIANDGVFLRSSKDDKLVPVWHEIKDSIERQEPWYARFMRPIYWYFATALLIWFHPEEKRIHEGLEWIDKAWNGVVILMFLLILLSFLYLNRSGVYLQREHEVQGFWDRYGEKIVFLIFGTVLGVIGKVVSDKLFGQC